MAEFWNTVIGKLVVLVFIVTFFQLNGMLIRNHITARIDGPTHISLGNQLKAVDWVFQDAQGMGDFNVDVYVPPVIPHAYDYLFLWQATKRCGENLCGMKLDERVEVLYTPYESDPPHPERLDEWMQRQEQIGRVVKEKKFGGITVQRRQRL